MDSGSREEVGKPTWEDNWFLDEWFEGEKHGYVHYVLITASRLRKGKTALAILLLQEMARLHGYSGPVEELAKYVVFDVPSYIEVWLDAPEWAVIVLDEPNRATGHRKWWTEDNQEFAEFLQTTAYQHKHGLFPLPSAQLIDNAIEDVVTANIIVESPGHATVYVYDRDLLNRTHKSYHYYSGGIDYTMVDAKLWHAYEKKRHEYTMKRVDAILTRSKMRLEAAKEEENTPTQEIILSTILASPDTYRSKGGRISPIKIAAKHKGVSWNNANLLASNVRDKLGEK